MNECCYLGRGKIYIIESAKLAQGWGNNGGFFFGASIPDYYAGRFIGNASALGVNIAYNSRQAVNRTGLIFDSECGAGTIDGASINLTLDCQSFSNLGLSLFGRNSETFTSDPPVVDQGYYPPAGDQLVAESIFVFNQPLVDTSTLIVKRSDTLAVLVDGTDYTASQVALTMLVGLPANIGLLLSYSWLGTSFQTVDAFTLAEKEWTLTFIGDNLAESNEKWMATFFKVKLTPVSQYNLINEDFQELPLTGILSKDHVQVTNGNSGYFQIKKVIQ